MHFKDIKKLRNETEESVRVIEQKLIAYEEEMKVLRAAVGLETASLEKEQVRLEALRQLQTEWRAVRFGKDHQSWFLVSELEICEEDDRQYSGIIHTPAFAEELVDDLGQAQCGRPDGFTKDKFLPVNLIRLENAVRRPCPCCQREGLVMVSYVQTHDSPQGDWWETAVCVLCPGNGQLTEVVRRTHR